MSNWNFNLAEVSTQNELVPEGKYTFVLGGGLTDDGGRLKVRATIASEGPFQGRRMAFSFPAPEEGNSSRNWVKPALKRFEQSLGEEQAAGEDIPSYLNRVAGAKFISNIQHRKYTPEGGNEVTRAEVNIFNFEPAL